MTMKDIESVRTLCDPQSVVKGLLTDFLWMCGSWLEVSRNPNWSGNMHILSSHISQYDMSTVLTLPFLILQPTSMDAIYSVLLYAVEERKLLQQSTCIVIFDQPLYSKAIQIVAERENIGKT